MRHWEAVPIINDSVRIKYSVYLELKCSLSFLMGLSCKGVHQSTVIPVHQDSLERKVTVQIYIYTSFEIIVHGSSHCLPQQLLCKMIS